MRIIHKRKKPNLAISKKGKWKNKEKKESLKRFQGVAHILDNNSYCLKTYYGIWFPGNLATLARLFDPKQTLATSRTAFFFLFYFVLSPSGRNSPQLLTFFEHPDINGDVRDAPPLFPRVYRLPTFRGFFVYSLHGLSKILTEVSPV
jgi:hypothetical protein